MGETRANLNTVALFLLLTALLPGRSLGTEPPPPGQTAPGGELRRPGLQAPGEQLPPAAPQTPTGHRQHEPVITVWSGLEQTYGHIGNPQTWVNILGNASDPGGMASLSYTLNGGDPRDLSMGPDYRRLADEGDFNIDIALDDLLEAPNLIVITAVDYQHYESIDSVTVIYQAGNVWPSPYGIDWDTVTNVEDVVQIVDGRWEITDDGLRTTQIDYDRLIAIGDLTWNDYEITAPITIHAMEPAGPFSGNPGLGFIGRWTGHTDYPVDGWQPKSGWLPSGAYAVYDFGPNRLELGEESDPSVTMSIGDTYWWKYRVESTPGEGGLYSVKVWPDGEAEPPDWNLTLQRGAGDVTHGSVILVAHHLDLTIGDILIEPTPSTDVSDSEEAPPGYRLHPCHPNPFTLVTTIRYDLPQRTRVELQILDITGRRVRSLRDLQVENRGSHSVVWDGGNESGWPVSSGVYLYRLKVGAFQETRRVHLLR